MFAKKKISPLVLSLLIVALVASQSGCLPFFSAEASSSAKSLVDIQAEVNTAVAATMVSVYVAETQLALSLATTEVSPTNPPPTPTPTPTSTQPATIPTETPPTSPPAPAIVTLAPVSTTAPASPPSSASLPTIWAEINTNCRLGPSTWYAVDGYLTVGLTSYVHGTDPGMNWWYIENPQRQGRYCWVWASTTHVDGNVGAVPVVAAAPQTAAATYPRYGLGYSYGYGYGYGYTPNPYAYSYTDACKCTCKPKILKCNNKNKWLCKITWVCKCNAVYYNPFYQYSCNNYYNQINWKNCWKNPGACGY